MSLPAGVEVVAPSLTEPDLDHQVHRLLDELPARFAVAGLSLGAVVAMSLVRRAPERVTRLAVLSTNPHAPTPTQLREWARLRDLLETASAGEVQSSLLPMLLSPAVLASRPNLVELTVAMANELGESTFDRQLRLQATRVDERPGLRHVRCPTLVLAAEGDRLCDVGKHEELASLVPGSVLQRLPDCAHLSPLERPELVAAAMMQWLCLDNR